MQGVHQLAFARRFLPPTGQLVAFEAVARTGSTAAAARELDLTQGTVSRLVQALEAQLGVELFLRQKKRLRPTEAALAYAEEVRRALDIIGRGSLRLAADPGSGVLALAILPTFGAHWLAPRLAPFLAAHPGVTINLATRLRPFAFEDGEFDAAIHFGKPNWPRAGHLRLLDEDVIAVAAPSFLAAHPVGQAADLLALPLLTLETRPRGWADWFAGHGVGAAVPRGMGFDQFATMMQAAIHGLGVALLPEFLVGPALAEGRLAPAFGGVLKGRHAYWLVWPEGRADHPPLAAFRAWLRAEAEDPA